MQTACSFSNHKPGESRIGFVPEMRAGSGLVVSKRKVFEGLSGNFHTSAGWWRSFNENANSSFWDFKPKSNHCPVRRAVHDRRDSSDLDESIGTEFVD